jgi:hypothetical protein
MASSLLLRYVQLLLFAHLFLVLLKNWLQGVQEAECNFHDVASFLSIIIVGSQSCRNAASRDSYEGDAPFMKGEPACST